MNVEHTVAEFYDLVIASVWNIGHGGLIYICM